MADFELKHPGGQLPLPVTEATEGPSGLEVSTLLKDTGHVTLDPGFVNTASCSSEITFIDGDEGILRYRGYPIDQLAEKSSFLEVSYLLIYGELPTPSELEEFDGRIRRHTLLHEDLRRFFDGFPRDAHPMAVLSSAVSALSTFYQDSLDPFDREHVDLSTVRLMAKLPTIASYAFKKAVGPAAALPRQLAGLRRQLPADDLRCAGRAVRGQRDHVPRPRHALRAARRPRAELLHLDGAPRRLQQRQPLRLGVGRRQRAVRPAARRRQPGRARDARGHPRGRRRRRGLRPAGQGQGAGRQADGLRPPRLQELRPARGDREEGDPRRARVARHARTRCSTSR